MAHAEADPSCLEVWLILGKRKHHLAIREGGAIYGRRAQEWDGIVAIAYENASGIYGR